MGEFACYNGNEIKIGTCEEMCYLRADQADKVTALPGNVDPVTDALQLRFRFPFPDEDSVSPGEFEDAFRGLTVPGLTALGLDFEHTTVQFTSAAGYLTSLPCPEGPQADHGLKVHRNGFSGAVKIVQQRRFDGKLVLICECGGCGAKFRLPTVEDAAPVIRACIAQVKSERHQESLHPKATAESIARAGEFWLAIAERILAGYEVRS